MKRCTLSLICLLFLPGLVACGAMVEAGVVETPFAAAETAALPVVSPAARDDHLPMQGEGHPEKPPARPTGSDEPALPDRGLIYLQVNDGTVYLLDGGGERLLGSLPGDASDLAFGGRHLAYVSHNQIQVLDLVGGSQATLYDPGERAGYNYSLRWSSDEAALAYGVVWDEPDGSRMVELGVFQGERRAVVDTMTARPAGPTPTAPPMPPVPPEPGFGGLAVLAYDAISGRLGVTPVGGQERYGALWIYHDTEADGWKREELDLPPDIQELALTPDLTRLALAVPGAIRIWPLGTEAPPVLVELPPETHARWLSWSPNGSRLAYLVNEDTVPGLTASPARVLEVWEWETGQAHQVLSTIEGYASLIGWAGGAQELLLTTANEAGGRIVTSLVDVGSGQSCPLDLPEGGRVIGRIAGR